jgi:hypothetical protein
MTAPESGVNREPASLASLNLPPTFVADHCIRTLFYQGAMSPADIAKHWRVLPDVASEVVESLKAAAFVEPESGQAAYERLAKVRLTALGQAQVANARARTWYAGVLPVALKDFERQMRTPRVALARREALRDAIAPFAFAESHADEIGQAIAGGATLALTGVADDEQQELARALGAALSGDVRLPFAVFASGHVIRMFDGRRQTVAAAAGQADDIDNDILRSHDAASQWITTSRPVISLAGGVQLSDVLPAYDEDARFYVAPLPMSAHGGLLAVSDAAANPDALVALARLWLIPGRYDTAILMLRSGERIELPWHAATVLFNPDANTLPAALASALLYRIDVSAIAGATLPAFISRRLISPQAFPEDVISALSALLARAGATRQECAAACRYLQDRAMYEGSSFEATLAGLNDAVSFATAAFPTAARQAA